MRERNVRNAVLGLVGCSLALALPAPAQDFRSVPELTATQPEIFRSLFDSARCTTVHAIIFGDSQETCPGGAGAVYIPRLQYEFWSRYGNAPETPLAPMQASYGGYPVYADWLLRVANTPTGVGPSRLPPDALPPGAIAGGASTLQGDQNINGEWNPQLVMLQPNGADLAPYTSLRWLDTFFDTTQPVYLDIFAAGAPQSGEVRVQAMVTPASTPEFNSPVLWTQDTSMGLQGGQGIHSARVGPLPSPGNGYLQVGLSGTRDSTLTDIVGARFVSSNPRGWSITSFSAGGYRATDLIERHGACGPVLGALNPDVAILSYGANDAGQNLSPAQFAANLAADIAFIRAATRPDLPIILLADPYRRQLTTTQAEAMDQFPAAQRDLALADPRICAVNSRRLMDAIGWGPDAQWYNYLSDGVHYSPSGAYLKAQAEAATLFRAFLSVPPCKVDIAQVPCGLIDPCPAKFAQGETPIDPTCQGDINADGQIDLDDLNIVVQYLAGGDIPYGVDPDVNRDGFVDDADAQWVVDHAGQPCSR